jgi:hypothetical protein
MMSFSNFLGCLLTQFFPHCGCKEFFQTEFVNFVIQSCPSALPSETKSTRKRGLRSNAELQVAECRYVEKITENFDFLTLS